ncbi:MAG: leucine-rich repeat protein [Treponema sp.]|jgi:hypothetical protein|nr:leucine-rich repeat protein [Treponema sp.]
MKQNLMQKTAGIAFMLLVICSLTGCIVIGSGINPIYHVYYSGNGNTEGRPPVDSKTYRSGDTATVMEKPSGMKKGDRTFLGWRRSSGGDTIYQGGIQITIGYEDISFSAVWAEDTPFLYQEESSGELTITGFNASGSYYYQYPLVVPDTLEGKPVTRIADNVFKGQYIDEITLPAELVSIGNNTFDSNLLTSLVIPNKVKTIGINAFQNNRISSLSFGASVESIRAYAFSGNDLVTLFLPVSLQTIGAGAFNWSKITVIEIGSNVDIQSDTSMGVYGDSFRAYYVAHNKAAGIYRFTQNVWKGPATDNP